MLTLAPSTPATWSTPIEATWQMLPGNSGSLSACKRPDLGLAERLFIGAVVNVPRARRPWGIITWLSDIFQVSRPTLYTIGARCAANYQPAQSESHSPALPAPEHEQAPIQPASRTRLIRTLLTLLIPGGVAEGQIPDCVREALGRHCSVGFISELSRAAGRRAGEVLDQIDHRPMGPVDLARDEIFTGSAPNLLLVEPRSLTITGLYATPDCDTETWACALLLMQSQGVTIRSLAEDDCRTYNASCAAIGLDVPAQKDVWHLGRAGQQVVTDVEREALRALTVAERLEKHLRRRWNTESFERWAASTLPAEALVKLSAVLSFWVGCTWDALEIVDLRSGEIRDRAINQWLLTETIQALRQLSHPRIQKFADRLEAQASELFTALDLLTPAVTAWQARTAAHFSDPAWARFFQATTARAWRLAQAVRNGHRKYRAAAQTARQWVEQFGVNDPVAQALADELEQLLAGATRASSAAEAVNSVLRPYFNGRREGTVDTLSRQLFLNLFRLWFNMHKFESGPRKGHSPYELAQIDLGTDDWLTLLGYPPD